MKKYLSSILTCLLLYNTSISSAQEPKTDYIKTKAGAVYSQKKMSEKQRNLEVADVLANYCKQTSFEDAAIVTDAGKAIRVAIPGSASRTFDGKETSWSIEINTGIIKDVLKAKKSFTLYHCHPSINKQYGLPLPSPADLMSATAVYFDSVLINQEAKVNFRIVHRSKEGKLFVTEYFPSSNVINIINEYKRNFLERKKKLKNSNFSQNFYDVDTGLNKVNFVLKVALGAESAYSSSESLEKVVSSSDNKTLLERLNLFSMSSLFDIRDVSIEFISNYKSSSSK